MPRISITQFDDGDPFAYYRGLMTNYIPLIQNEPYYYEYYGPVTYETGTVQVFSQGAVTHGTYPDSIYVDVQVAFIYGAGGAITGFRIGSPWVAYNQPGTYPDLVIS